MRVKGTSKQQVASNSQPRRATATDVSALAELSVLVPFLHQQLFSLQSRDSGGSGSSSAAPFDFDAAAANENTEEASGSGGPHRATMTSTSGPAGVKRPRPSTDDAEPSSSAAAGKRRRRAGVSNHLVDDDPDCREGDNAERAEEAAGPVSRNQQRTHQVWWLWPSEIKNLMETAENLLPFDEFIRLVREINCRYSREVLKWRPSAFQFLHEASMFYLVDVFIIVNQLAKSIMRQPQLFGDETILTPEEVQSALSLSQACTSGIPIYILTAYNKKKLVFGREFTQCILVPHLLSNSENKIFAVDDLTGCEIVDDLVYKIYEEKLTIYLRNKFHFISGHKCALTFEEGGGSLSMRVHILNGGLRPRNKRPEWRTKRIDENSITFLKIVNIKEAAKLRILFSSFSDLVKRHVSELLRFNNLQYLHELAMDHMVELYELVNRLVIRVTRPHYGDNTSLTHEQEQVVATLSFRCTSGIPPYVCSIKQIDLSNHRIWFNAEFTQEYLSPLLRTKKLATKIYTGYNQNPDEVIFFVSKQRGTRNPEMACLSAGWMQFVKRCGIKIRDVCAFSFEKMEGTTIYIRVHVLNRS